MTLDQLEAFVHVARARNFSRAGAALGLAQPTLSGRVAALEGELRTRLFARHGHTVELTEAGHALLSYAERMLALRAEGTETVRRARMGGLGRLTLGANPSCSQYLAPRLIAALWQEHPGVTIHVRTALTPALMEDLLDGAVQLVLGSLPQMHPRAEVLWRYEDALLLLAAPSHPLAQRAECTRADLVGQRFLSTLAGPTQQELQHLLSDPEREVALEGTAGEVMKRLACAGAGLTVLPRLAVWDELAQGMLVAIRLTDVALPPYEVALAAWPGRALAPASRVFLATVREVRVPALLDAGG
jgi:DNA-binding transcriptional LysR family regulator